MFGATMDQLFEAAALAVLLWRAVLGAAGGALLAYLLSLALPALSSAVWFGLVFLGASAGFIWHVASVSAREAAAGCKPLPVSRPVAFLAMALVGGVWGALAQAAWGTVAAVVVVMIAPFILGPLFGRISGERVSLSSMLFAVAALLAGLTAPYAIQLLFSA